MQDESLGKGRPRWSICACAPPEPPQQSTRRPVECELSKMVLCCGADFTCGKLFSLGLLMLIAACCSPFVIGQQGSSVDKNKLIRYFRSIFHDLNIGAVGVSLKLWGVTIPNNSFVDIVDILYRAGIDGFREDPTNYNAILHDQALLCVTDLINCCESPPRGEWYFPNGMIVPFNSHAKEVTFRQNRGQKESINGRQFHGSVRLFRRWSKPSGRGRFRCELPSAADPNVTQTLYANIGEL